MSLFKPNYPTALHLIYLRAQLSEAAPLLHNSSICKNSSRWPNLPRLIPTSTCLSLKWARVVATRIISWAAVTAVSLSNNSNSSSNNCIRTWWWNAPQYFLRMLKTTIMLCNSNLWSQPSQRLACSLQVQTIQGMMAGLEQLKRGLVLLPTMLNSSRWRPATIHNNSSNRWPSHTTMQEMLARLLPRLNSNSNSSYWSNSKPNLCSNSSMLIQDNHHQTCMSRKQLEEQSLLNSSRWCHQLII